MRVLCVVGTRPEAIKMAPVITALREAPRLSCRVCATGQHREMLHGALASFGIVPDRDLDVMVDAQTLNGLASTLLSGMDRVLEEEAPDVVLVHGDTTTAMAAAMAAFHRGVRVGHVEAGLRTGDLARPWPEEMNRRVIDVVASDLFAPTARASQALRREALGGRITVTGNTVVDALALAIRRIDGDAGFKARLRARAPSAPERPLVLVTCHRRENFGGALVAISDAIEQLGRRGLQVVLPVHRNPNVRDVLEEKLVGRPHIELVAPLDYLAFIDTLRRASVVLTDSGGVQEEAASLGKPLVVMRETTERPEGLRPDVQLVGCETSRIVDAVVTALGARSGGPAPALSESPYGDGRAAARIVAALSGEAVDEFVHPLAPHGARARLNDAA